MENIETKRLLIHEEKNNILNFVIELKKDNKIIGEINYNEINNNIEFYINSIYQNNNYCYESLIEVLKYLFLKKSVNRINAIVKKDNNKAINLLEKLAFKKCNKEQYTIIKNDFLKELFRKEKLYITEDIDKDPYIVHLTDDNILNITGENGSGKTTSLELYKNNDNIVLIDTNQLFGNEKKDKNNEELYNYLKNKYKELKEDFNNIYLEILDYYKKSEKFLIIESDMYKDIKDISILKGELIVVRTCVNTCFNRCIEKFTNKNPNASLEDIYEYTNKNNKMYIDYHELNKFIDKIDNYIRIKEEKEIENG